MIEVPRTRSIKTPPDLATLIRELKAAVAGGVLEQVRRDPSQLATDVAISDIPDNGPWPDYIELRFRIRATGAQYKLAVETYHGAGGTWGPD